VLQTVADALPAGRRAGFVTEEIRVHGERRGFALVTFDGRRAVMADVARAGPPRVGKYGVDVEVVETVARTALAVRARAIYVIDEIGKMECLAPAFVEATRALLDARVPLVATVGQRGGGFIAAVKRRPDVTLWEVTRANRDAMPARVLDWIRHAR
jgi:nucleoside-triphosphatase